MYSEPEAIQTINMANKKSKPHSSSQMKGMGHLQLFRRLLHSSTNLRVGLARARAAVPPSNFPEIVRELGRIPIYKSLFAPMTFPMTLADLVPRVRLQEISVDGEFLWNGSVLSLHSEQIKNFVKLRDAYYKEYLAGRFDEANQLLDSIEKSFGFSLWLLGNRLQLLQITKGLEAQKTLLEEILSTKGINQFIAWIVYFLSLRAEENVSYLSLRQELSEVLEIEWLQGYVRHHLLPIEFASIENCNLTMAVEEPHPIVDRFETFVAMAQLHCAKNDRASCSAVLSALELLEVTDDSSIARMIMVLRDGYSLQENQFLRFADAYTEGRYEDVLAGGCDRLELVARSYGFLDRQPPEGDYLSPWEQMVSHAHHVLTLSESLSISRQKLKKLALLCPDRSKVLEVVAFLDRAEDKLGGVKHSVLDMLAALCSPLDNPSSAPALSVISGSTTWLSQMSQLHPSSSALRLRVALATGNSLPVERNEMNLPLYRQAMYLGHVHFLAGRYVDAAASYMRASETDIDFVSNAAKRALFKARYASGNLIEAIQLAIDQILRTPSAADAYPLEELARRYLKYDDAKSSLDLVVLLNLAIRYSGAKLERELSNIYENFMEEEGLVRPSDLGVRHEHYDKSRLIYFLRYICVPRVLDDTTCFNSVEEIDQERISVCQILMVIDQQNLEAYQTEIRSITRGSEVASLLSKMQTSKIYVDEAGIRESLESSLTESLSRYVKLLDSPALAYQAEKLSKRIREMLNSKGHPEFKDLKLPATEREGLFNAMLLEVVDEFALNPAYGLDTHVSTSIRHGAFEGHLRRPLALENLLCLKKDKEYILPEAWREKLPGLHPAEFDVLQKLLGRFSQRFEELIQEYLKGKIHIRLVGDKVAMFDFESDPAVIQQLMESISSNTTFNDLSDRFIAHCWALTTQSLDRIRLDLLDYAAKQMNSAFDALVRGVESSIGHATVAPLIDAVARGRTAFQTALEDVAGWFQRPTDLSRDPFDIEVATHVALQQIANCYVRNPIHPSLDLAKEEKIDGRMLDGLCEILFILLQNIIRHSGYSAEQVGASIAARRDGDKLILRCKNKLAEEIQVADRRQLAVEAMAKYERDSALRMARKEGGSGLSKIWRIAEFDLRLKHEIKLEVTDDREFIAQLSLAGVWT